jgi:hypothetical protein
MHSIEYLERLRNEVFHRGISYVTQPDVIALIDSHIEANKVMLSAEEKLYGRQGLVMPSSVVHQDDHDELVATLRAQLASFGEKLVTRLEEQGLVKDKDDVEEPVLSNDGLEAETGWRVTRSTGSVKSLVAEYHAIIERAEELKEAWVGGFLDPVQTLNLIIRLAKLVASHQHVGAQDTDNSRLTTAPVG